jgi:hypothetical protein
MNDKNWGFPVDQRCRLERPVRAERDAGAEKKVYRPIIQFD